MRSFQCKINDCDRKIVANELCQYHYDRLRRYGDTYTRPSRLNCEDCGVEFQVRKTGKLPVVCDACFTERHRQAQRADRRRKGLWEYYKMTVEDYKKLYDEQDGVCAICGGKQVGRGQAKNTLSVDHNHTTGKIRGLLCTNCNTGIGNLKDKIELLEKAIIYLKERN